MSAKILLIDIETAPILGYAWAKYDTSLIDIVESFYILSFAYKWLGTNEIIVRSLPDYKDYKPGGSDKALMQDLYKLLDEADIVVAHNGTSFDIKKINARLLVHGLPPPSTFKIVDTLRIARKHFKFDSNTLNDLGQLLGVGKKIAHVGWAMWRGCMSGDSQSWKTMREYNVQDVALLEEIYLLLRPWTAHPDVTLYGERPKTELPGCPTCGSHKIQKRGIAVARTRRYQRLNCQDCGTWFSGALEK